MPHAPTRSRALGAIGLDILASLTLTSTIFYGNTASSDSKVLGGAISSDGCVRVPSSEPAGVPTQAHRTGARHGRRRRVASGRFGCDRIVVCGANVSFEANTASGGAHAAGGALAVPIGRAELALFVLHTV